MEQARGKATRQRLKDAAVRLVSVGGHEAASVRAIARAAGVTEGAMYRHFRSKVDLHCTVYRTLIEMLIKAKAGLVADSGSMAQRLQKWVDLTFDSFDDSPDAFKYVMLAPPEVIEQLGETHSAQSRLYRKLLAQWRATGELRDAFSDDLAIAVTSGILLNVVMSIDRGDLPGPASTYAPEIGATLIRMLGVD